MNILKLIGQISNGVNLAFFELDNMFYRASDVKVRQQLILPGLAANKTYKIDLDNQLNFPLLVTGVSADIATDDTESLELLNNDTTFKDVINLYIEVLNRKTNKVIKKMILTVTSAYVPNNELIIEPQFIYKVKSDKAINSIVFTGEPVHLRDPIVFLDSVNY